MATMPGVMNNHNSSQMSTPIDTLPLKTTRDSSDIEDPMVQSVLKEFEQDMYSQQPLKQIEENIPQIQQEQVQYVQQPIQQPMQQVQFAPSSDHLKYSSTKRKRIIDMDIAKKAAIITLVSFLIYYSNISYYAINKLPDNVKHYTSGKELLINMMIVFLIFYTIIYLDLL
jgi:hypothetical protein